MSIASYSDLQTAVANWMARSGDAAVTAVIPDCVTLFEAFLNRRLRVRQMQTSASVTITAGAGTLPTDYLAPIEARWPGTTSIVGLELVTRAWMTQNYPDTPSATPAYYIVEGTTINVMPIGTATLTLRYWQKIPALSAGNNWLFNEHPDLYLFGTLVEGLGFLMDAEKAAVWLQRRDLLIEEILMRNDQAKGQASIRTLGMSTP